MKSAPGDSTTTLDGWQDMEEAPRDGTKFLAYLHDCDGIQSVFYKDDKLFLSWDAETTFEESAGWQPLPVPRQAWLPWWELANDEV
jgi:hypothetical protein